VIAQASEDAASADLARLTRRFAAEHGVSYAVAMRTVLELHPDLRDAYGGEHVNPPAVVDTASEEVRDRVRRFIADAKARGETIEYGDAMRRVFAADRVLAARYGGAPAEGPDDAVPVAERVKLLTRAFIADIEKHGGTIDYSTAMHRVLDDPKNRDLKRAYARS